MITTSTQKMFVSIIVFIVLLFVGYFLYIRADAAPIESLGTLGDVTAGEQILSLVDKLNTISIDKTIFTSSLFTSLVDYSLPLSSEQQGRVNPFAVIGVEGAPTSGVVQGNSKVVQLR